MKKIAFVLKQAIAWLILIPVTLLAIVIAFYRLADAASSDILNKFEKWLD